MSAPIVPILSNTPVIDLRPDRTRTYGEMKPILDRILVRQLVVPASQDGFEVPDKFRQQTRRGEVLAIGDYVVLGKECIPLTEFVQVGDIVWYGEYTAEQSKDDPTQFMVRIQDVRGVSKWLNR